MNIERYKHVMPVAIRPDFVMERGQGSWIWDDQERRYLDWIQGWAVNCLGHCSEVMIRALHEQSQLLINPSPAFYNAPQLQLADLLAEETNFHHIFFTNSGAEANEGAIKLARKWAIKNRDNAYEIITLVNSFHGRTLATMSASGKPEWEALYEPKVPGFRKITFDDLSHLETFISSKTVAVMVEPIQGEGGVVQLSDDQLRAIRKTTTEKGILFIVDEIQTGVGRTGRLLACQRANVQADILTLGKGLGGGIPIAALLARREISCFEPGDQGGTFNGNPLVCAVSLAVVKEILSEGFLSSVLQKSSYFIHKLQEISKRFSLGEVRGSGLLLALELGRLDAKEIVNTSRSQGLLINSPRPSILRFMPALNITQSEIDHGMDILHNVIAEASSLRDVQSNRRE